MSKGEEEKVFVGFPFPRKRQRQKLIKKIQREHPDWDAVKIQVELTRAAIGLGEYAKEY